MRRLAQLTRVLSVHMRHIGLQAAEMLLHHLHFVFKQVVLLASFVGVVRVALEALDFRVQTLFVLLSGADIVDG